MYDFTDEEKGWIEKCKAEPQRYRIAVDNDCIAVGDWAHEGANIFTFAEFGYEFARQLLRYIGCNAEMV